MNKTVFAVIIALIVGGGLWFVLSGNNNSDGAQTQNTGDTQSGELSDEFLEQEQTEHENSEASGETIQVVYTDNGFEPREITINQGDTVTWTNRGGPAMRVASDDHPEHLDYPGFDQLDAGTSYSFTFDQTGTWGYHNHEDHGHGGTITVN